MRLQATSQRARVKIQMLMSALGGRALCSQPEAGRSPRANSLARRTTRLHQTSQKAARR